MVVGQEDPLQFFPSRFDDLFVFFDLVHGVDKKCFVSWLNIVWIDRQAASKELLDEKPFPLKVAFLYILMDLERCGRKGIGGEEGTDRNCARADRFGAEKEEGLQSHELWSCWACFE